MSELGPRLREYFDAQGPPIDVDALVAREQVRVHGDRRRGLRLAVALVAAVVGVGLLVVGLLVELDVPVPIIAPGPDETGDQSPSGDFEESGSWTVETSLGPWTWTWIPEHEGAQDLWAEAERIRPSGEEDVREGVNRVVVPVPSVAGMDWAAERWSPWHPRVRWARSDAATVALARVDGWVDVEPVAAMVEQVHGVEACLIWLSATDIALIERDESDCFWDDPSEAFATLTANLVGGDPAAVEYRDQQTGELVLRLEAADPAVSAEQLVVGRLWHLLVDDGAGFGLVEPPWDGLPVIEVDVAVGPEGFVAVAVGPADWPAGDLTLVLHRWGSPDGVEWHGLGDPVALPLHGGIAALQLAGSSSGLVVLATHDLEETVLWSSVDGVAWQQVGPPLEGNRESLGTGLVPTRFGWMLIDQPQHPEMTCEVWVSPDGVAWEQVPFQPDVETRREADLFCSIVIDDAVYVRMEWWPPPPDEPAPPPGFATEPAPPEAEAAPPLGCAPVAWQETGDGDVQGVGGGCGLWIGRLGEE